MKTKRHRRWFLIRCLAGLAFGVTVVHSLTAAVDEAAGAKPVAKPGNPAGFVTLAVGDPAPDFALPDIDGRVHTLPEFSGADVLMVLFTSNHCPSSHAIEQRLRSLRADLRGRSFALVAINPNHPDGYTIDELGYSEFTDSFADMKPCAENLGWDFPYLYDSSNDLLSHLAAVLRRTGIKLVAMPDSGAFSGGGARRPGG